MADLCRDVVYRANGRELEVAAAVAGDDAALVKAYEEAIAPFQGSDCEEKGVPTDKQEGPPKATGHSEEPGDGTVSPQEWGVGSRCRARWSGDGLVYPAVLVWVRGFRGRVKFDGYGNEEELELSTLLPGVPEPWTVGSQCRAVWSGDGLVYPAVLVSIDGDRGRVQFDGYGNEEEVDLHVLLPSEGVEHSASSTDQALERSPDGGNSSSSDWKKRAKQKIMASREGPSSPGSSCYTGTGEDSNNNHTRTKKERKSSKVTSSRRGRAEGTRPTSARPFPSFPSAPAANESSEGFLPLVPPLPPLCALPTSAGAEGGIAGLDEEVAHLSSMLLSWYLCGYHTGYYMASQCTGSNAVTDTKKPKQRYKCEEP